MYEVSGNVAKINGNKGKYDGYAQNPSEQYGRNAVDNMYTYYEKPLAADINPAPILDFSPTAEATENNISKVEEFVNNNEKYLASLPPLEFEYRYLPNIHNGQIDKTALKAASKEEMGGADELSVEELDYRFAPNESYTSKALDINKDGKVDTNEYSASFLAADILSKDNPDINKIDGTINKNGSDAVLAYSKKSNIAAAEALYGNIYKTYLSKD